MAGQWIEWEKGLTRKPEVLQMARALKISTPEAAARCMLVWEWVDDATTTGHVDGCDRQTIDEIAGLSGFAQAMENTRPHAWISFDECGSTFTNYERHNGECSKKRAMEAKRQREYRKKQRDKCHGDSVTNVTQKT